MPEPTTISQNFVVPNTGDLPGAWGTAAVNPNFVAIDGTFGGFINLGLSSSTTILLTNPGTPSPGAGPTQSQNACIYLSGTLTGNCVVQLTTPKEYIFHNQCTGTNAFFVQVAPAGGTGSGMAVGLPPGRKCKIFFDGTNVDYSNPSDTGTAYDLHGVTTYPPWMNACSIAPYLLKDGSVYSTSAYTALGALLGSTFGGDGITTFGVPDERARARIGFDSNTNGGATNRLSGASGVTGTTMGSAGGSEILQSHNHSATLTDAGHVHAALDGNYLLNVGSGGPIGAGTGGGQYENGVTTESATTGISVALATAGTGNAQNVQPSIVSFLPLIKT